MDVKIRYKNEGYKLIDQNLCTNVFLVKESISVGHAFRVLNESTLDL